MSSVAAREARSRGFNIQLAGGINLFGEAGRHARSAVGMAELPLGTPVEVEVIVEVAARADQPA